MYTEYTHNVLVVLVHSVCLRLRILKWVCCLFHVNCIIIFLNLFARYRTWQNLKEQKLDGKKLPYMARENDVWIGCVIHTLRYQLYSTFYMLLNMKYSLDCHAEHKYLFIESPLSPLSLCYSIVYYYNGANGTSSSYRLVDCIRLWSCFVSSKRLCVFGLHGAI